MFNSGFRPAVNPGLSVSRVGGSAQIKAMKKIAGPIRIELAQYRELAAFSQFGSDLDADTKRQLDQGERIREMLKQPQYQPMSIWEQTASLIAAESGKLDTVPVAKIKPAQAALLTELWDTQKEAMRELNKGDKPDEKTTKLIEKVADKVMKGFTE